MAELIEENKERLRYLERQVEEEREARRRADPLLARLMDRVPELEAPLMPTKPEPAEPAEPADPARSKPDREDPKREEPEKVDPQRPLREEPERPDREDPEREELERVETEKVKPMPSEPREEASESAGPRSDRSLALQVLAQRLRRPQSAARGGGSSSGLGSRRSLWRASGYRIVGWANVST
jgi:outer membrane biosynthesis protein TonB